MPAVTVPCRPSGEPIAITGSPTASAAESPSRATVSCVFGTLITARSLVGSRPTIFALAAASLLNVTTMLAVLSPAAADDHVVVGQHVAVAVDDDARPDRELRRRLHRDRDHGRADPLGDARRRGGRPVTLRLDLGDRDVRTVQRVGSGAGQQPADTAADEPRDQGQDEQHREARAGRTPRAGPSRRGCRRRRRRPRRPARCRAARRGRSGRPASASSWAGRPPVNTAPRPSQNGAVGSRQGSRSASGFHHGDAAAAPRGGSRLPGSGSKPSRASAGARKVDASAYGTGTCAARRGGMRSPGAGANAASRDGRA